MNALTPTKRDLLEAVERGEVTWVLRPRQTGWEAYKGHAKATARMQSLLDLRLVERAGTARVAGVWRLTPAGRAALASTSEAQQ